MHHEVSSPRYFDDVLEGLSARFMPTSMGLVLVPQEGLDAGLPLIHEKHNKDKLGEYSSLSQNLATSLSQGESGEELKKISSDLIVEPISGPFSNPIGYLWLENVKIEAYESIKRSAIFIADVISKSKKSRLHEVVSQDFITDGDLGDLFSSVAKAVKSGLYCEEVIVWARQGKMFKSFGLQNWDLLDGNSLVASAYTGSIVSVTSLLDYRGLIYHRDKLIKRKINSFFLVPVFGRDKKDIVCVVGVFYRRRGGTTTVDLELVNYIIRYFEVLWVLYTENSTMRRRLHNFGQVIDFHERSTACMLAMHEVTAIFSVLESLVSTLKITTRSDSPTIKHIDSAAQKVSRAQHIFSEYADVFATAGALDTALHIVDGERIKKINISDYIKNLVKTYESKVSEQSIKISIDASNSLGVGRFDLDHIDLIVDNYLINAFNALKQKNSGDKRIDVRISWQDELLRIDVSDDGPGIAEHVKPHIFTANYTTRRREGGRGLGLAIVWKIGMKYGKHPEVTSVWGYSSRFSSWIRQVEGRK